MSYTLLANNWYNCTQNALLAFAMCNAANKFEHIDNFYLCFTNDHKNKDKIYRSISILNNER